MPKAIKQNKSEINFLNDFRRHHPYLNTTNEDSRFKIYRGGETYHSIIQIVEGLAEKEIQKPSSRSEIRLPRMHFAPELIEIEFQPLTQEEIELCGAKRNGRAFLDVFRSYLYSSVTLPSGRILSREEFRTHPLFEIPSEKDKVFSQLADFINTASFQRNYNCFISKLSKDNWFEGYTDNPTKLALFSIVAFFEGTIDKEELFVMNTLAQAYHVLSKKEVSKVNIHILSSKSAANYLRESGFPLFTENHKHFMITNRKHLEEIQVEQSKFLKELDQRSSIKRTVVEYTITPFDSREECIRLNKPFFPETGGYYLTGSRLGFREVQEGVAATIVLLPIELSIELLRKASHTVSRPASDHMCRFGYSADNTNFYKGIRDISIPSPLFPLPKVHDFDAAVEGLSMLYHDLLYHMPLDINNPHLQETISIAIKLKQRADDNDLPDRSKRACVHLSNSLIDRDSNYPRFYSKEEAFARFLERELNSCIAKEFEESEAKEISIWLQEVFTEDFRVDLAAAFSGANEGTPLINLLNRLFLANSPSNESVNLGDFEEEEPY